MKASRKREATPEDPLEEKWLVAFRNISGNEIAEKNLFIRQFYAPGFYEAYDIVIGHAEKLRLEVVWFREKSECGKQMAAGTFPLLEAICTYCNMMFNHQEPIPCAAESCSAEFCSRGCLENHQRLRHGGNIVM